MCVFPSLYPIPLSMRQWACLPWEPDLWHSSPHFFHFLFSPSHTRRSVTDPKFFLIVPPRFPNYPPALFLFSRSGLVPPPLIRPNFSVAVPKDKTLGLACVHFRPFCFFSTFSFTQAHPRCVALSLHCSPLPIGAPFASLQWSLRGAGVYR